VTTNHDPISVSLANGTSILSTPIGTLPLPGLPAQATEAFTFNNIDYPLLSIGQLCDADCIATFCKHDMDVSHSDKTILTGHRDASTNRLWQIDLPPAVAPLSHWANAALHPTKIKELIAFSHASLGSPIPSTLEAALAATNELQVLPDLTLESFRKHTPNSVATAKAHLNLHACSPCDDQAGLDCLSYG